MYYRLVYRTSHSGGLFCDVRNPSPIAHALAYFAVRALLNVDLSVSGHISYFALCGGRLLQLFALR